MSTCDITSGFTLGCRDNTGGIANLYILSGSISSVTDASEGLISTISGSGEFFKFELFRQTSDFSELSGTAATGVEFGALNGYSLTFTGQEPNPASEISGSAGTLASALSGITLG